MRVEPIYYYSLSIVAPSLSIVPVMLIVRRYLLSEWMNIEDKYNKPFPPSPNKKQLP